MHMMIGNNVKAYDVFLKFLTVLKKTGWGL